VTTLSVWQGAWYIAKSELRSDRWKILITFGFVLYVLLFSIPLFMGEFEEQARSMSSWAADFLYLTLLPCLGFVFNRTMFSYLKNDYYSKKLASWRILPITTRQMALGRLQYLTLIMTASLLIFFTTQYIFISLNGFSINLIDYALYGLLWYCYSLTIATAYVYWEIGHTGKRYFWVNAIYLVFYLVFTVCLTFINSGSIVTQSFHTIENGNWWIVIVALVVLVIALMAGMRQIERRLDKRNYTN